jgi:hypothetical protein
MKFDDIWNAEPPTMPVKKPSGMDRLLGNIQNHFWYRPLAFWTAVFSRSARQ